MKKLFYGSIFWMITLQVAQAQVELVPLSENVDIQRYLIEQAAKLPKAERLPSFAIEKNTCDNLQNPNVTYVQAGQTLAIKIQIDTAGFGKIPGTFGCNCQFAEYGTAELRNDTLFYTAKPDVNAGEDRIRVEFCDNANPGNCRTRTYRIVARRSNRSYFQTPVVMAKESTTTVVANSSVLPGRKVACNALFNCADNYAGRGQEVAFASASPTDRITYRASRFAGVDSVCVVLCDTFAICDTFKFAFRITGDTLKIPFMDDFSYFGPYPAASHWLDLDAFVNNDMADTPPSWGVATFDGLNSSGTAYGGGTGIADRLTSNYVNLSNVSDDVYLTYWVQRRGFGDRPEAQDSFIVELKDRNGKWVPLRKLPGSPINESNTVSLPFAFYSEKIPTEYKHPGFQFRFSNRSERTGILDVWHLDYVRLDRNAPDSTFNDLAFTRFPNFILKRYSAMPWQQFKGNEEKELSELITVNLRNHADEPLLASPSTVRLFEISSNREIYIKTLFNGLQANIPVGIVPTRNYSLKGDTTGFTSIWESYLQTMRSSAFEAFKRLDFRLEYVLKNTGQSFSEGYKESVERNDSVRRFTNFSNYYSYDDGTAEAGLIAQRGIQVAAKYTLNKPDTLRALQFHFPRTTVDIADQVFDIKVWVGQLDNTPEYIARSQKAAYADIYFDTLQGFTTYPLANASGAYTPLALPAGDVYIGWEQISTCDGTRCIPVGYDRNTPQGKQYMYRNTGNAWELFPTNFVGGSLMVRPVVGSETPLATSTDEVQKPVQNFAIFPNPTRDMLHITPRQGWYEDFQFLIFSTTGQQMQQGILQAQLQVQDLPAGIYFLKIADRKTQQIWNEKFIIAR